MIVPAKEVRIMHSRRYYRAVAVLLAVSAARCSSTPTVPFDWLGTLGSQKSEAEQYAHEFKAIVGKTEASYSAGREKYIHGKASFDGWIDAIKGELVQGHTLDTSSAAYAEKLRLAQVESKAFVDYAKATITPKNPIAVADVADALVKIGTAVWDEYQKASAARRDDILKLLDNNKWQEWDPLPAPAPAPATTSPVTASPTTPKRTPTPQPKQAR
jgi:hypothetical protein